MCWLAIWIVNPWFVIKVSNFANPVPKRYHKLCPKSHLPRNSEAIHLAKLILRVSPTSSWDSWQVLILTIPDNKMYMHTCDFFVDACYHATCTTCCMAALLSVIASPTSIQFAFKSGTLRLLIVTLPRPSSGLEKVVGKFSSFGKRHLGKSEHLLSVTSSAEVIPSSCRGGGLGEAARQQEQLFSFLPWANTDEFKLYLVSFLKSRSCVQNFPCLISAVIDQHTGVHKQSITTTQK